MATDETPDPGRRQSKYRAHWVMVEETPAGDFYRVDGADNPSSLRQAYLRQFGTSVGVVINRGTGTVWLPGRCDAEETAA